MQKQIGKYRLQKELGKGASGTVYLAVDTFAETNVALKVIDSKALADPEAGKLFRKQFLNEASLAGKLNHPHIVSILEAVVDIEPSYIATEYVPGGNLSRFSEPDALLSVGDAMEIGFKCCGALEYASRHGIVHRDIKPANIMVVQGTDVKVGDFGAAYFLQAQATQISAIGSPSYASPEQLQGRAPTHQSDMFALGVVLYQLVTGRLPFEAETMNGLFQKILTATPQPPSALSAALTPEMDGTILRALNKDPAERYPSWADFALQLAEIGSLSVYRQAIPDSERYRALRRMSVLSELDDAEIWELVHAGRWNRRPPRSVIIRENEPGESLYFIAEGEVKVTKKDRLLNILKQGESIGEMSFIQSGETIRQATVESTTDVLLVEFQKNAIKRLGQRCRFRFSQALLRILGERLALADTRILQLLS